MRRGASLVELLLAIGLLGLLFALLAAFGPPTMRTWIRSSHLSEAQRSVLLAVQRVRHELKQASPESLTCPGPTTVRFLTRFDAGGGIQFAPTGEPLWQKWVTLSWAPESGQLGCTYHLLAVPEALAEGLTFPPGPSASPSAPPLPSPSESLVCRNLKEFRVAVLSNGLLDLAVRAECHGEKAALQAQLAPLPPE